MRTLGVTGLFLNLRVLFMTAIFVHETITKGSEEFNLAGPFGNLYGIINHCQNPASKKVLVIAHGFQGLSGRRWQGDEAGGSGCSLLHGCKI
jgi:hypothetical protein